MGPDPSGRCCRSSRHLRCCLRSCRPLRCRSLHGHQAAPIRYRQHRDPGWDSIPLRRRSTNCQRPGRSTCRRCRFHRFRRWCCPCLHGPNPRFLWSHRHASGRPWHRCRTNRRSPFRCSMTSPCPSCRRSVPDSLVGWGCWIPPCHGWSRRCRHRRPQAAASAWQHPCQGCGSSQREAGWLGRQAGTGYMAERWTNDHDVCSCKRENPRRGSGRGHPVRMHRRTGVGLLSRQAGRPSVIECRVSVNSS